MSSVPCTMLKEIRKVALEHLFLAFREKMIGRTIRQQLLPALIIAITSILRGNFTQLGTFLRKKDGAKAA